MSSCKNCSCALDPQKTKEYHRDTFYCGTDGETGRISVACSVIAVMRETIEELNEENKRLRSIDKTDIENGNTEEDRNGN